MNPANIAREEALHRSTIVTPHSYQITVDLTGTYLVETPLETPDENFVSTSVVSFTSTGEDTWIDLIADKVIAARLDGVDLDPAQFVDNRFPIRADAGLHELTLTALGRYSRTGEGLHRFVDPADGRVYLYTQFETADARRMFANFEQPNLKATFQFSVLASKGWAVLSNSLTPTPQELPGGISRFDFAPTLSISTYLTALIAGEYYVEPGEITTRNGIIPASLVCRQSMADYLDSQQIRTTTQRGFDVYESAFDTAYPFDTYDQIFVPEFNAGAMENVGCVTFRDEYLFRSRVTQASYEMRDNTILHELAHMWFGDLVTMRWWDDLWLNESFAEWAANYSALQISKRYGGVDPWVGFANQRKSWAYTQDQMPTTHPIAADMVDLDAVEQNFDGITYAKGASVLKQLVAYVGEPVFLAGIAAYFRDHAFGNTTFADLLGALTTASGRDLSHFAAEWLETAGVNTLCPSIKTDENDIITSFAIQQTAHLDYPTLRTHHLAIGSYNEVHGRIECVESQEVDLIGELTELPQFIGRRRPDLILLNDRDLAYAKVRLDPQSLASAINGIDQVDDPLARAVIYSSAWDMWRDAEMSSRDFIDLVLRSLPRESDMTAVKGRLSYAQLAVTSYAAPSVRANLRSHLTAGLMKLLTDAEPGSDHQLAFADALLLAADSTAEAELITDWLHGEQLPEGLVMDADRRWKALTTLARLGAIDESTIKAEFDRDQTISGAEFAAGASAALATPQAKAKAWTLATADGRVPNGTHSQICFQFWQFGQEELLSDYAERYLELAETISRKEGIWAKRGHATIETALTRLWPTPLADEKYLAHIDSWLAKTNLALPLVRTIQQRRDESLRNLAAQKLSER